VISCAARRPRTRGFARSTVAFLAALTGSWIAAAAGAQPTVESEESGERRRASQFSARLVLADGRPAAGRVVSVVGTAMSVPIASDGRFTLDPAPAVPFVLVVSGPDGELSAPIEISALDSTLRELRLEPVARDSVTVVSGVAPSLDLLPASAATVVSAEALEQRPPQRIVDALEVVAGASKLGDGADSVPALRGLARGRTLILLDGARVSAERRAGPSATFVDPAGLAAVEVLRGPGSVVYGSDAFGGVLSLVTRDPERDRRAVRWSVDGSTGGRRQTDGALSWSQPIGEGALLLAGHAADAADAEAGGGETIFNSGFAARGGAARWLAPAGAGQLRVALQIERVDDLGKAAIDSRDVRSYYPREDSDRLVASWFAAPSGQWDAVEITLFYGRYRVVLDRDRSATSTSNRRIDRSDTDARDASARAVVGRAWGGGRLQVGADLHSRFDLEARVGRIDFAADGVSESGRQSSVAIAGADRLSTGLFATWSRPLAERWTLGVGTRVDRVSSENRGGYFGDSSDSAAALAGNLSLGWTPAPGWTTTLQVARGFRVPTLSDLYFRGPSGRGFVTGNPALDPESSRQLDLAVRRTRGRTAIGLYAYHYVIDDLVERYRAGDDFFFRNRGAATIEGAEVEIQSRLDEHWSIDAGGAWSRGRTEGGATIDDVAAPRLFAGARFASERGYVFARLALFGQKDDPGPTELARPSYATADLGGGWQLDERLELRLSLLNALDRRVIASPDEAADLTTGRSWLLALGGRF